MSKASYTDSDVKALEKANPFLEKTARDKYARYKSADPFPQIGEALLNSADLLRYLKTVGIVEPFDIDNLKGVTYQCSFSGEAHRYDRESEEMEDIHLNDGEELVLEQNSITYLKIEEKFHVPEYMALRFNLSVSHAYKGLLLGTGPIIDPGFDGNLFIPLHNLTGNEYVIKKGAPLIRVEFTKLSRSPAWGSKNARIFPPIEPITKETPAYASFSQSISDALRDPGKKQFYTKRDNASVRSSIPDAIQASADKADEAHESAKIAAGEAQKSADTAKDIEKKVQTWTIAAALSVIIAIFAVLVSVYSLIQDANVRYDSMAQEIEACKQQICALTQQLELAREQLEQYKTAGPQDDEQGIGLEASGETGSPPPSSPGEAGGDFNGP